MPSTPRVGDREAVVLAGMSLGLRQSGRLRRRRWSMSLASWLSFEGLLRPGKALNLQCRDIVFPSAELIGPDPNLVIVTRNPKTRRVWKTQFVARMLLSSVG